MKTPYSPVDAHTHIHTQAPSCSHAHASEVPDGTGQTLLRGKQGSDPSYSHPYFLTH